MHDLMSLYLAQNAKEESENQFAIWLSNGKRIRVLRDAYSSETDSVWAWRVDTQYFSRNDWALQYLRELIAEELTGIRILHRKRGRRPEICGDGCLHPNECNRMLCSQCPTADAFFAGRDGVKIVYAIL